MDGIAAGAIILAGQLMITIDFQWVNKDRRSNPNIYSPPVLSKLHTKQKLIRSMATIFLCEKRW